MMKIQLLPWIVATLIISAGCVQQSVDVPTSFGQFTSKDKTFRCEHPETWDVAGGGKRNSWATFISGSASVRIWTDVSGSMMSDFADHAIGNANNPQSAPVVKVHSMGMDRVSDEFAEYAAQGDAELFDCELGPACRSVFTSSTPFGGNIRGYHATLLAKDKRVVVACSCNASDWEALEPSFARVLESFARGR